MKHARVAFAGAVHNAVEVDGRLRLSDGRTPADDEVVWLPPFVPRTIFAVGLNYADHVKELAFSKQEEPLIFLKGPNSIAGHRAQSRRPADATFMHYECELAVVIGKTACNVSRNQAYDHIAGYTVANDYAIRDYLENYYRPNLRVKNRDALTLLGPWLVDAADVADPMNLALSTRVNGKVTQQGTTKNMIFDVPFLIDPSMAPTSPTWRAGRPATSIARRRRRRRLFLPGVHSAVQSAATFFMRSPTA
jgi:5-oxopent-3-ene-1,2,5-tricarboxylate decarboxylase / 2-hydroxyhepta-2,4-diene-1,7-dioate isomerase